MTVEKCLASAMLSAVLPLAVGPSMTIKRLIAFFLQK